MPNVNFEGLLDSGGVAALFRGARAVVVPSLLWETFGYVVLEAFAVGTPVIVRNRGALPELVGEGHGGLVCDSDAAFVEAARRLTTDERLRSELGARGKAAAGDLWSEAGHVERYCTLIDQLGRRRGLSLATPGSTGDPQSANGERLAANPARG